MLVAVEEPLAVAGDGRQLDDLARVGQPRLDGVRRVQRRLGGGQRGRDRDGIADPARHLDRLLHQHLAARAGRPVAQRRGQAREQPDAQRAVGRADDRDALLQQRDEAVVREPVAPQEAPAVAGRGAREQLGLPRGPGDVRGAQERRLRAHVIALARLRLPQRQQHRAALRGRPALERGERQLVQAHRLLVRVQRDRARSGAGGVVDRLGRARLVEVVGELGEVRVRIGRPSSASPTRRCSSTRRARESVWYAASRISAWAKRMRPIEPGTSETTRACIASSSSSRTRAALEPADPREHGEVELAARARTPASAARCSRRRGGAGGARSSRGRCAGSRAAPPCRAAARPRRRTAGCPPSRRGPPRPARRARTARRRSRSRPVSGEPARDRLPREGGERVAERFGERRVHVAVGADDQDPAVGELAGHELQQQQRGLVGGVQVVEHEHERLRRRGALQERGERVEEPEARALGLDGGHGRQVGQDRAQLRQQLRDVDRPGAELRAQQLRARRGGRTRAATAPTASTRARRPPPSSARRAPARRAPGPARSAPPRAGSCRSPARRRAGTGARGPRPRRRGRR